MRTIEKVVAKRTCPFCAGVTQVHMTADQYRRWTKGLDYVQVIFAEKPAEEREVLISGICPACWQKYARTEDDECE